MTIKSVSNKISPNRKPDKQGLWNVVFEKLINIQAESFVTTLTKVRHRKLPRVQPKKCQQLHFSSILPTTLSQFLAKFQI
jgi:hypothetical protein